MKTARTCEFGHKYYKSSDCLSCPICEQLKKPDDGFLSLISAPARRALLGQGIDTLSKLTAYHESEILKLHGVGPSIIVKLNALLAQHQLSFKK